MLPAIPPIQLVLVFFFLSFWAHYAYVETPSKQSQKKYKARIVSPEVTASKACLSFLYRMNGANDAKLRVKLLTKSGYVRGFKWTKKGQYGDRWLKARMDVKTKLPYKVSTSLLSVCSKSTFDVLNFESNPNFTYTLAVSLFSRPLRKETLFGRTHPTPSPNVWKHWSWSWTDARPNCSNILPS